MHNHANLSPNESAKPTKMVATRTTPTRRGKEVVVVEEEEEKESTLR